MEIVIHYKVNMLSFNEYKKNQQQNDKIEMGIEFLRVES